MLPKASASRSSASGAWSLSCAGAGGGGAGLAAGERVADRGRQRIGRAQQREDAPAAGGGGVVDGVAAIGSGGIGGDAQVQQAPHQRRGHRAGAVGQQHGVAALAIDRGDVGLVREQAFEHAGMALRGRIQPRRAAGGVARFNIGASGKQGIDDVAMAGRGGFVQRAAPATVARVQPRPVLEQQLHAGRIVVLGSGGGNEHRYAIGWFDLGAAFEQEPRQPPVAGLAGHRQWTVAFLVERVDRGGRIA